MTFNTALILTVLLVAANIPWISEKFFLFFAIPNNTEKRIWMRLVEWFAFASLALLFSLGLEQKSLGLTHSQDWEFYAIFFSLFVVFAFPSFIFRHLVVPLRQRNSL